MGAKLAVDLDRLADLLRRVGRENLVPILATNLRGGIFVSQEYRDEWICLLAADHRVSSQEIADCFFDDEGKVLTRARIGQIVQENQSNLARKASSHRQAMRRLAELDTNKGRAQATAVMGTAAAVATYWKGSPDESWSRLNRERVLQALGFLPTQDDNLKAKVWSELREREIITEDTRVGVAVRYGLGIEDPPAYLWHLYYGENDPTLDDVRDTLNEGLRAKGVLTVADRSLVYYMRTRRCGDGKGGVLAFKSRGHRRPNIR